MDNLITISNTKANILEFDVEINGVDTADMAVRFIIEASSMELGFDSKKGDKTKWSVEIPALAILEKTSYPFHIDIIVDGYYFEPLCGSVNVVGEHTVYASKPENITLSPGKPKLEDIIKTTKGKEIPPKTETIKPEKIPLNKPESTFKMQPVKVKDGKELFNDLMSVPKVERKTNDKLDDQILNIMKKAKEDKVAVTNAAKEEPKKEAKNEIKKPKKESKKSEPVKKAKEKTEDKKTATKSIAEKIIETVTGLGGNKEVDVIKEKSNDDKIKDIIKEETIAARNNTPYKKAEIKEAGAIKKITNDKKIISFDESKEQNIKDILKTFWKDPESD